MVDGTLVLVTKNQQRVALYNAWSHAHTIYVVLIDFTRFLTA